MAASSFEERVLVLAPIGRDASIAVAVLSEAGIASEACPDIETLCGMLTEGAGAALLTEEALSPAATRRLVDVLSPQPPWSDLPLVVLTSGGETTAKSLDTLKMLGSVNATLLERPVRQITLVKTVQMALRGRRRQYEVRDHLAARERARLEAEAANSAKDTFLAMLAHELRNPLSAVRNAVATARLDESRRPRALEIAWRQSDQLGRLIDDLLDVARVTQGRITLRKKRVRLADVIEEAVESMRPFIESRGLTLRVALAREPIRVEADPARLEQVFVNLLSNAAKYTKAGGQIDVVVEPQGEEVAVRIRDTGIGIAPEMLPRLWDLFMQADRTLDRAQGGLGIGLTVTRRLVELHGARIEAQSQGLGQGAEFVVTLPALPTMEERRPTAPAESIPQRTARVLVVEDNADTAESLTMFLELLGHRVRAAYDGVAALDAARANVPDVMLVDIGLPGMDGYEVARRVRRDPDLKQVVLVALTGYGQEEVKHQAMAAGFDYHLVKPVNPDALHGLVARLGKSTPEDSSTLH
jgi:signal transduction histidine kinase/ActR/RegA family two-component response regulator